MKLFGALEQDVKVASLARGSVWRTGRLTCAFVLLVGWSACITPDSPVAVLSTPPPVPEAALNASYGTNRGLLSGLEPDGTPTLAGEAADPAIAETLRFYDTLGNPAGETFPVDYPDAVTGDISAPRATAPPTLQDWKRIFGFPVQADAESLQDFRDRTGIVIYYNRNELGLGRELGCAHFIDGYDAQGAPIQGTACFVTNYGPGFRQEQLSLLAAMDGQQVRNTVCITHRPSLDATYQVQFYVYGASGKRQDWARLDTLGPRPHPQVCMTCHGGGYDDARHLARNAHFLPLDPNLVVFVKGNGIPAGVTREGQEERIRVINVMATDTPLTPSQQAMLSDLYNGSLAISGTAATGDPTPAAWRTNRADSDFHRSVLRPYCSTCHQAAQRALGDAELWTYQLFNDPTTFDAAPTQAFVCNSFFMPNAQPTSLGFWETAGNPGVAIAGRHFPSAADAFLARKNLDRASCTGLDAITGCNRGDNPDAVCGGAVSGGATCDDVSNRCVPFTTPM
jgi:hypothetical protein